jgi:hypothetical protein
LKLFENYPKFRCADVITKNLKSSKTRRYCFLDNEQKKILRIYWPVGVYHCVQEKAAIELDKEIPEKRTNLDGVVASCAAVC